MDKKKFNFFYFVKVFIIPSFRINEYKILPPVKFYFY